MEKFQRPETIICPITITRKDTGALTSPATSMKITITDPSGSVVVNDQSMSNDGTGLYHYDYTPSVTADAGTYHVRYKATNGSRVTIEDDSFDLDT